MNSFSEDFKNEKIPNLQYGEYKTFTEQNSPANKKYILTYSLDSDLKSNKQFEFSIYVKDAIGGIIYYINAGPRRANYDLFVKKYVSNIDFNTIIIGGGDL